MRKQDRQHREYCLGMDSFKFYSVVEVVVLFVKKEEVHQERGEPFAFIGMRRSSRELQRLKILSLPLQ